MKDTTSTSAATGHTSNIKFAIALGTRARLTSTQIHYYGIRKNWHKPLGQG